MNDDITRAIPGAARLARFRDTCVPGERMTSGGRRPPVREFRTDQLGIRPGTTLEFDAVNGNLVARKPDIDPVSAVFGCLRRSVDPDKFIARIRGSSDA